MSKFSVLIVLFVIFAASESRRHFFEEDDDIRQLRTLRQIQLENYYQDAISSGASYEIERHHRISKRGIKDIISVDRKRFRTSFNPPVKAEVFGPNDEPSEKDKDEDSKTENKKDSKHGSGEEEEEEQNLFSKVTGGLFSKRSVSSKNEHKVQSNIKPFYQAKPSKHHKFNGKMSRGRLMQEKRTSFDPVAQSESFGPEDIADTHPKSANDQVNQISPPMEFVVVRPQSSNGKLYNKVYKSKFRRVNKAPPPPVDEDDDDEYDSVDLRNGK